MDPATDACTIDRAIGLARAGDTVSLAAGDYGIDNKITVDKAITIDGAGNGDDPSTDTIITRSSGSADAFWLAAPAEGTSDTVTVGNLRITGFDGGNGISVRPENTSKVSLHDVYSTLNGRGVELHGPASFGYDVTIADSFLNANSLGIKVATNAGVAALSISGSELNSNTVEGLDVEAEPDSDAALDALTITDSQFNDNALKGIYVASLTGPATLTNVQVKSSGTSAGYGSGIEFNVYHSQDKTASIDISNATVTGSGTDSAKGAGIKVNARGDKGQSPAVLTSVKVTGSTITGAATGILLMTDGAAPSIGHISSATVTSNEISGNTRGLTNTTATAVDASLNWWGTASAAGVAGLVSGSGVDFTPFYTSSDMDGSENPSVTPGGDGAANATNASPVVRVPAGTDTSSGSVNVTVASGTNDAGVDYSELGVSDGVVTVPATTVATGSGVSLSIAADTSITAGDLSWAGVVSAPVMVAADSAVGGTSTVSGALGDVVPGASVGVAVRVGSPDTSLTLDKAARLVLPGQAGKRAGFIDNDGNFTAIGTECSADDQASATAQLEADHGACVISDGSDLVIWTMHFTTFVTYGLPGTVTVTVDSMISLSMVEDTVAVEGVPGARQSGDFTYVVTTNAPGYTVSVKADQDELESADATSDSIAVGNIVLGTTTSDSAGTAANAGQALTTTDQKVFDQDDRSAALGDSLSTPVTVTIPFVDADTYTGTVTFTATAK